MKVTCLSCREPIDLLRDADGEIVCEECGLDLTEDLGPLADVAMERGFVVTPENSLDPQDNLEVQKALQRRFQFGKALQSQAIGWAAWGMLLALAIGIRQLRGAWNGQPFILGFLLFVAGSGGLVAVLMLFGGLLSSIRHSEPSVRRYFIRCLLFWIATGVMEFMNQGNPAGSRLVEAVFLTLSISAWIRAYYHAARLNVTSTNPEEFTKHLAHHTQLFVGVFGCAALCFMFRPQMNLVTFRTLLWTIAVVWTAAALFLNQRLSRSVHQLAREYQTPPENPGILLLPPGIQL